MILRVEHHHVGVRYVLEFVRHRRAGPNEKTTHIVARDPALNKRPQQRHVVAQVKEAAWLQLENIRRVVGHACARSVTRGENAT